MSYEIRYSGYATEPSDYECPDGQLASSLNLLCEDGRLKPLFQPETRCTLQEGMRVVFIHETASYKHYLISDSSGDMLYWTDSDKAAGGVFLRTEKMMPVYCMRDLWDGVVKIGAVGNTLVVLDHGGLHYLLWKNDNADYRYLGQKPPEVTLQFSLSDCYPASYDRDTIETTDADKTYYSAWRTMGYGANDTCTVSSEKSHVTFKEERQSDITQSVWALINQTNSLIAKAGHFYAPFFVRYAYRLYDGSLFMQSAPVFMPVAMPASYFVEVANVTSYNPEGTIYEIYDKINVKEEGETSTTDFKITHLTFRYRPANVALTFRATGSISYLKKNWSDIVKSIDVFVSLPLTREDADEKIKTASIAGKAFLLAGGNLRRKSYPWSVAGDLNIRSNVICDIPMLSDEAYLDKIKNNGNFYKIASLDLDGSGLNDGSEFTELPVDESVLPVLATQETLDDDYKSRNILMPASGSDGRCISYLYPYNSRLNVSGIKEKLFGGFGLFGLVPSATDIDPAQDVIVTAIVVFVDTDEGEKAVAVTVGSETVAGRFLDNCPLFYPDNRAVRMVIRYKYSSLFGDDSTHTAVLPMEPCPLLNGAFTQGGIFKNSSYNFTPYEGPDFDAYSLEASPPVVSVENKVYTSQVNNPFLFPAASITTIGTGTVLGICSAAKALSQGQFGQFPLYAFTTEGVWAMEVSSNGTYSARQPITRDVCISPDSITQLDSEVLFATDRGIMLVSGSSTVCLSDAIFGETPFDALSLPHIDVLHGELGHGIGDCFQPKPFLGFLSGCRMLYDYVRQRVIVFNPSTDNGVQSYAYAYVYSIKSKQWGMLRSALSSGVNSYPDALAMTHDNRLVSFSGTDEEVCQGLYLTRPLKLGLPDTLKSVSSVVQRGFFGRGEVTTVLYGSRDLRTWHLVWSSRDHALRGFGGTPYKYFRLASSVTLSDGCSVSGASVLFAPRYDRKLR